MTIDPNVAIGRRIAALRKKRELNQAEFARLLGVDHKQVVSSIEKGERSLKVVELSRIAGLLHVSPLEILGAQPKPASTFVLWRQPREDHVRLHEEAAFLERCRRYAFVERLAGVEPASLPLGYKLVPERASFELVAGWAERARRALGLGEMPAAGLQEVLEQQHGIKIFVTTVEGGSGAACQGEFGSAILVNAGEPRGRRAFSLAHEVFHLLTWDNAAQERQLGLPAASDRVEQLAENFAAALILPSEGLERRMPPGNPVEWRIVKWVELAREFGVTVPALAWRLVNLGKLQRAQTERIINETARATAGATTAGEQERPLPERYVTLAFHAYVEGEISIGKLAELLETTVGMLPKTLLDYGFDLDSDAWQAKALPS